jgi:signal transduction histidine kinase
MKKHSAHLLRFKSKLIREHSLEMLVFFNEAGRIIAFNHTAARELGFGDELLNKPVTEVFKKSMSLVDGELNINSRFLYKASETIAYRKNQTCFAVDLKIATKTGVKNFLGVCFAINISENKRIHRDLKHMKHELKASMKTKSEFVANISHELKTPVNGIMGLTESLMETELTPKQLETMNIILRCCNNMNALINDLLDFTKIGSNKLVLEQREFTFRRFIDEVITFNIKRINEKGLKLIVNIASDIPNIVIGDERRLTQILNNLFSNAIKFTSVGQIALEVVKTSQTKDEVELFFMVMDTGIGISLEERDKLFQSFSQVDGSITRRFGGTGLGLSICKMLVEAMHGNITVDSETNAGSTFSFSVRLALPDGIGEQLQPIDYDWFRNNGNGADQEELFGNTEKDYIGKLLSDTNFSLKSIDSSEQEYMHGKPSGDRVGEEVRASIEKLMLCFEMENWSKAEEIATYLKRLMPEEPSKLKNKALLLLMSVRKEEHDKAVQELKELQSIVEEVADWKT